MKGVILAGGTGSRLYPLTKVTNKHLLPIYDKPMIYYPIETLKKIGLENILIVSGRHHAGDFLELLGSGEEMGLHFNYTIQEREGGIAEALSLAKDFCGKDNLAVILGDNFFTGSLKKEVESFKEGARIFLKKVENPTEFGIAELDGNKVVNIEEKPKNPKTNYAVTGLYLYDCEVFDIINSIKPSKRGELEITDVNNCYIKNNKMDARFVRNFWIDAGTSFEDLYNATKFVRSKQK